MDFGTVYDTDALFKRSWLGSVKFLAKVLDLEVDRCVERLGSVRFVLVSREMVT